MGSIPTLSWSVSRELAGFSFSFLLGLFFGLFSSVAERFTRNEQVGNSILPRGLPSDREREGSGDLVVARELANPKDLDLKRI